MRISEISPEIRPSTPESLPILLGEIESCVQEVECLSPKELSPEKISGKLQRTLSRLSSFLPVPESGKLQIWKLSYRLWNACVDLSNAAQIRSDDSRKSSPRRGVREEQARLRQISADLLFLAANVSGIPSPAFKTASFYYRTGLIWHDLKRFDLAANCFERATDLIAKIEIQTISSGDERKLLLDLNLARSRTAWDNSERNLSLNLLNRSKKYLFGNSDCCKVLAEQYLQFGKAILSKDDKSTVHETLKLLNEALDLCEKGLQYAKRPDEAVALKIIREKTLRFLGATHLHGEEFENVLKCVKVLRDTSSVTHGEHPSVAFMAMKAWLGLGKHAEAEKELRGMVLNKGAPEAVLVSAVESFFQEAGTAEAEGAKAVLLGLLGRCDVSAGAVLRVIQKIASGAVEAGEASQIRTRMVAEIVSDDRVVVLFTGDGEAAAKDKGAMHAVLWNWGAELFRRKNYHTAADMFEKSMLYVLQDESNRILRAKSFRVLCLCHLALSQLDRADEYINEAEKLDPNIACAFLKFKILLQKKDEDGAISQVQAMVNCIDFKPDFLTLSAHEAMASRALSIAIASLSILLNLYANGKPMPIPEVTILRQIIALLVQNQNAKNEFEVLKLTRRARDRSSEIGVDEFFGKNAAGNRELIWFAGHSWNMGITTGREKNYEMSSEFWQLASEFYDAMGDDADGVRSAVCKSLILCVAAMIAAERIATAPLTDSEVKRALQIVDRAGKMIAALASKGPSHPDDQSSIESSFIFLHTFNAYDLNSRMQGGSQKHIIQSLASSRACNPEHLLQIGHAASQGQRPNPEAAEFAYSKCLTALLAAPSPDYQSVALVVRKLVTVAGLREGEVDEVVYGVYREAYRIMVGLKDGEYPVEEGKWLATTAWNRSVLRARLGQMDGAKKWMQMGLQLAQQVPGLEGYRSCMEKCIASAEKDCAK